MAFWETLKTTSLAVGFQTLDHSKLCDFENTEQSDDVGCKGVINTDIKIFFCLKVRESLEV